MTGLIYVVIIALWAAVLIPIWLRRHDQISEVRSTARFSSAMSKLGSQGQVRYAADALLTEADMADTQMLDRRPPSGRPAPGEARMPRPTANRPSTVRPAEGLDPDYERELARQAAATRRAVVLGSLTALLMVALVLAIVGVLPRWAPVLAAVPVVAFVVAAAMTASARTPARRSVTRPSRRVEAGPERGAEETTSQVSATAADDDWENWNAWDDDSWEPVPTTLPTYVTAPRASEVPRGIDRAHDGEWTGEAMVETAQAMRSRPRSAPLEPMDVDHAAATTEIPVVREDYDGRRAVNE